jgi:tetratricopeptide (TPR) repeat protein
MNAGADEPRRDADEDPLDLALGAWLERREDDPTLLPGAFAAELPPALQQRFLDEIEALAAMDQAASLAPPRDLPIRFDDFRILGLLGQGGMGAVYLAEQVSQGRRVAVKVLHAHTAGDVRSAARFEREARTAASLVHPGIVPIHGFGEQQGAWWLAMGLVEGRSLQRLLTAVRDPRDVDHARAAALLRDPRQLARAIADAADALEFAHRKNVVHRDVKPANLMVADDGHVVVLDFGLATSRHEGDALTRTGDFLGTPLYMAPEQANAAEAARPQSDVYALGAVLYECLTGRPPVLPGPLPAVLDAIRHQDPPDVRRLSPAAPLELALIAQQCLEKNPARRYATAAALADDLRRFVDGQPVAARSLSLPARWWRRARRHPAAVTAAIAALLLAAGALVLQAMRSRVEHEMTRADRAVTRADEAELAEKRRTVRTTLALSPEGITVFGGASQRFYARFGLAQGLPDRAPAPSPAVLHAIAGAEAIVAATSAPADQRLLVRTLMDAGYDAARTRAAIERLFAMQGGAPAPADLALQAVFHLHCGDAARAMAVFAALPPDGHGDERGEVSFYEALFHQARQDYFAAIAAFDRALDRLPADDDLRYFALLHRGWCRTCPEVARIRDAEDDLLAAATLRPQFGTARLLWAALRLFDPSEDPGRPVAAVGDVLQAVGHAPWVTTLVARVLVAIAAASSDHGGALVADACLSPLAPLCLEDGRRRAVLGVAIQLLDGLAEREPDAFEVGIYRATAEALLGRFDGAAGAFARCERLAARAGPADLPIVELLRARLHFVAGHLQAARDTCRRALELAPGATVAMVFAADLAEHAGDLRAAIGLLVRAADGLAAQRVDGSVFPDAAALLPHLRLRSARLLLRRDQPALALDVLDRADFGGPLHGAESPRVRAERLVLRARALHALADARAAAATRAARDALAALPERSPLLCLRDQLPMADGDPVLGAAATNASTAQDWQRLRAAQQRGWLELSPERCGELLAGLPSDAGAHALGMAATVLRLADARPRPATLAPLEGGIADAAGRTWRAARIGAPLLERLAAEDDVAVAPLLPAVGPGLPPQALAALLGIAERAGADRAHAEARLLKAGVLMARGEPAAALAFLQRTAADHADDARGHLLLACAATLVGDEGAERRALDAIRRGEPCTPADLVCVQAAARVPVPDELLRRLEEHL